MKQPNAEDRILPFGRECRDVGWEFYGQVVRCGSNSLLAYIPQRLAADAGARPGWTPPAQHMPCRRRTGQSPAHREHNAVG